MTPERLRPHLEAWLAADPEGRRPYVVHLDGPWTGAEQLIVAGSRHPVDVRVCRSELAIREELSRERPDPRPVVLLSPVEISAGDVLARIAKRRVLRLHAWDAVQHLFGVRQIDPRLLREKWMAEALVQAAPVPGGYERTAAQALDADRAWTALLRHRYGIDAAAGLRGLMTWAGGSRATDLVGRPDVEVAAVRRHLQSSIHGAEPLLAAVAAERGAEAVSLGLAVRVLADSAASEARATARTLLSVGLGGWTFDEVDARAWAQAAEEEVQDRLDRDAPAAQATLQAADAAVRSLRAEPLVGVSGLLAAGLQARLRDLGGALAARRAGTGSAPAVDAAVDRVREHRLSDHQRLATMVGRLVRWLATDPLDAGDLPVAAAQHVTDGCYADWARIDLRIPTSEPMLDEELRNLVAEADARRTAEDIAFGQHLAAYVAHAAPGGPVLGVEEVLDRVVAPIAAQRPVLLLVLDGLSHRVAAELAADVAGRGWIELRPHDAGTRALVLSALPSATTYSRTSLLSGALVTGTQVDEIKAFKAHAGLKASSPRGGAPLLFHKGTLTDPSVGGLAADVRAELAGDRRVVGAVVNAIDDHLSKHDQLATPWSATYIPLLRLLLDEARNAGRIVIVASDHGHVLDHGGGVQAAVGSHGARYREASTPAQAGEQLVSGTRVLAPGGSCILAVDERIRYTQRHHGYHGGGSPQEVLAPLLVLAPSLVDTLDGWIETPYDAPAWWTGQVDEEAPATPSTPALSPEPLEDAGGQLSLAPPPVTIAEDDDVASVRPAAWIDELLTSEAFVASRGAASRGRVPEERLVAILHALAGGKLLLEALSRQVGVAPARLRGTLAAMRGLLNVDGLQVLTVNDDSGDVELNLPLLREQFALPVPMSGFSAMPSPQRRADIVAALRRGSVPERGLDAFAVGLDQLMPAVDEELRAVAGGAGAFKAIRGDYGTGKTFFVRYLAERAKAAGFATSEVQISETETPLHRLETVYRRTVERLATGDTPQGALRTVLERWGFALEEDVLATGDVDESDEAALQVRVDALMEGRLAEVSRSAPLFATALRAHRAALAAGDNAQADGVLAWIGAQPNVPAAVKRAAGFKGEIDHLGAFNFLQGLLVVLRDSGHAGLVLVLDEIETLQRVRSDVREKSLNALRQLIDETYGGRFPGLYLVITGTPAFYDGPQGVQRLPPLAQRLHTDFGGDPRFDNPRDVQLRLPAFDFDRLVAVGVRIRDIYVEGRETQERLSRHVDDSYVRTLAGAVAGELGGGVGIAPRIFLKKLVDVLDRVDQFPDFDPRRDYALTLGEGELTMEEREARAPRRADDIPLDL